MPELDVRLDQTNCRPGGTLTGRVVLDGLEPPPRRIAVSLLWHTSGKGEQDVQVVARQELDDPQASGSWRFAFQLPDQPLSFSGTLITLEWLVEVLVSPGKRLVQAAFVLAPDGQELRLTAKT